MGLVGWRKGYVQVLELNRPNAANALDRTTHQQLVAALLEASSSEEVKAVVLAANGDRVFCAGADLKEHAELPTSQATTMRRRVLVETLVAMLRFSKPMVCAVQARVIGAGLFLALCADSILSAPGVHFSLPEGRLGMPAPIGEVLLTRRCGAAVARRIALLGEEFDAEAMLAYGAIDGIASATSLRAEAQARAATLGELDARAYRKNKRWINEHLIDRLLVAGQHAQAMQDTLDMRSA